MTKIQRGKQDVNPGPQSRGIKSDSILKTKTQEMEMEDCESGPQLQDLKSLRTITGLKVLDVKSMSFSPGPHLESMPSEVITENSVLGMKPAEINLQGETPVVTPRTLLLATQPIGLDSGFNWQDLKYPELIMGMKLQGIDSMEQQLRHRRTSEVITGIQDVESSQLHPSPDLQSINFKVFCPGSHLEDVSPACSPNIDSKYVNSSGYIPGPYLQDMNSSVCIPEPNAPCINSECNPGIHLAGANSSSCFSG